MYGETLPLFPNIRPASEPGRKEAISESRRKPVDPDSFYLGLKPFSQLFPAPRWLTVGHGPPTESSRLPAIYHGLGSKFPPP